MIMFRQDGPLPDGRGSEANSGSAEVIMFRQDGPLPDGRGSEANSGSAEVIMFRLGVVVVTLAALLLAGCMVGPKYHKPFAPTSPAFKEPPPESFKEWKTAQPGDRTLRANWWEIFGDPRLNSLEEQVVASNQ